MFILSAYLGIYGAYLGILIIYFGIIVRIWELLKLILLLVLHIGAFLVLILLIFSANFESAYFAILIVYVIYVYVPMTFFMTCEAFFH